MYELTPPTCKIVKYSHENGFGRNVGEGERERRTGLKRTMSSDSNSDQPNETMLHIGDLPMKTENIPYGPQSVWKHNDFK